MRKVLIGLMMAGTLLAPVAANAQERGERQNRHVQREDNAGGADAGQRQERRAPRVDQQRVQPAPDQVQITQRGDRRGGGDGEWRGRRGGGDGSGWRGQRGGSGGDTSGTWRGRQGGSGDAAATGTVGGWQGPRTPQTREDAARYDRRARDNALRYGTQEQRREVYRERRDDRRDWRQGRADRRGSWDRGWRNDRRYSWQDWRYRNRNLFRVPAYYSPYGYGYGYRRYSVGLILDQLLFGQRYWISNPYYYRLPPAPYGTQWIRYYNDVILVDVYTGEILDVIHDFFW